MLVGASGCGDDSGGVDMAADLAAKMDLAAPLSRCGKPGDVGNSKGVGRFCLTMDDCATASGAKICSTIKNGATPMATDSYICSTFCTAATDTTTCGSGAACNCDTGTCACVPLSCIPDGGT
jgi:hypothetical protein